MDIVACDAVGSVMWPALLFARRSGARVVVRLTGIRLKSRHSGISASAFWPDIARRLMARALRYCAHVRTADERLAADPWLRRFAPAMEVWVQDDGAKKWARMIIDAARPSLGSTLLPARRSLWRWLGLATSPYTSLRFLEHEAIAGLSLHGRVLDVGGGARSSYYPLLRIDGELKSVNVDERVRPTHLHDLNRPLPFSDASFDHVISLNTFEHIRDDRLAISESIRVLRAGGSFHFVVPFLYRVHASPGDFTRRTHEWWEQELLGLGVDSAALRIEPLVWSRLVTAYSFFGNSVSGRSLRAMLAFPAVVHDAFRRNERLRDAGPHRRLIDYALGWYISGLR
ncbi:MAG TPA: methyltransferase domain-containing protein [Candidatus Binatia bacterium]|nr:methyltransferase domain-containing protein [Candidatus Binatia bacterium]